jgi:hypothetical protein
VRPLAGGMSAQVTKIATRPPLTIIRSSNDMETVAYVSRIISYERRHIGEVRAA